MANVSTLHASKHHDKAPWDPEKVLAEALAERAEFLEKNPKYKGLQKEIDQLLDKAGTQENRMTVMAMLMEGKLIELHGQLKKLNHILIKSGGKPDLKHLLAPHPNLMRVSSN